MFLLRPVGSTDSWRLSMFSEFPKLNFRFIRLNPFLMAGLIFLSSFNSLFGQLQWDSLIKKYEAKPGETNGVVIFHVTNTSNVPIVVEAVRPSCHCTIAKVPAQPWRIGPGEVNPMEVTIELTLKWGAFSKTISVETKNETNLLTIIVTVPEPDARGKNRVVAFTDRQAVFKGDCASCHLKPAVGKSGEDLYRSICAICHEAEHRAEMVPDLAQLKVPTDSKFWEQSLRIGKPGTLMPAFSKPFGGPLTPDQIQSLVIYLTGRFPSRFPAVSIPSPSR